MRFYLGNNFKDEYASLVAGISSDEYYINMMRAWYFATALSKKYENIIPYIEEKKLDMFTHNKTIQKQSKAIGSHLSRKSTSECLKYIKKIYIQRKSHVHGIHLKKYPFGCYQFRKDML